MSECDQCYQDANLRWCGHCELSLCGSCSCSCDLRPETEEEKLRARVAELEAHNRALSKWVDELKSDHIEARVRELEGIRDSAENRYCWARIEADDAIEAAAAFADRMEFLYPGAIRAAVLIYAMHEQLSEEEATKKAVAVTGKAMREVGG